MPNIHFRFSGTTCWADDRGSPRVQQHIVGFCGKIYPVLVCSRVPSGESAICYSIEEVDSFVERTFRKKEIEEYRTKKKYRWR